MPLVRLDWRDIESDLPAVCMCCGQPAATTVRKSLRWYPGWAYIVLLVTLVASPLIAIILLLVLAKRATIHGPFCDRHRRHWFNRDLLVGGGLLVLGALGAGAMYYAITNLETRDDAFLYSLVVCLVLLLLLWVGIVTACFKTAIHAKRITDREILLQGVHSDFVEALIARDQEGYDWHRDDQSRWRRADERFTERGLPRNASSEGIQE